MATHDTISFARTIAITEPIISTDSWLLFSATSPGGSIQVAVETGAYQSLIQCAAAEMTVEDARDNALMEIEVELEKRYRANPNAALHITVDDVRDAVARYE